MTVIGGKWQPAVVKGRLVDAGWGANMGYPGLVIDDNGDDIHGHVFESENLGAHWEYLDQFEGAEYRRTIVPVVLVSGEQIEALVYVLRA